MDGCGNDGGGCGNDGVDVGVTGGERGNDGNDVGGCGSDGNDVGGLTGWLVASSGRGVWVLSIGVGRDYNDA